LYQNSKKKDKYIASPLV